MMNIALYLRVSTTSQARDGYSIEGQEAVLTRTASFKQVQVVKTYVDAGYSGADFSRPGLQEMLRDTSKGIFSEVWVWNISRLSRKIEDLQLIVETFEQNHIGLYSYNEGSGLGDGSLGKFLLVTLGAFGELQRGTIKENCRLGRLARLQNGRHIGSRPYGYIHVVDPANVSGGSKLVVVEKEAAVVRDIFSMYLSGIGVTKIIQKLNSMKVPTIKGNLWHLSTVQGILRSVVYIGKLKYKGKVWDGSHEPIISEEIFLKAQLLRLERTIPRRKKCEHTWLIQGLVQCPLCGRNLVAWRYGYTTISGERQNYYFYICNGHKVYGWKNCNFGSIPAQKLEETVVRFLSKHLRKKRWRRAVYDLVERNAKLEVVTVSRQELKQELREIKKKEDQLLSNYLSGDISKTSLENRMLELSRREKNIEAQIEEASAAGAVRYSPESIDRAFSKLEEVFKLADPEDLKLLIHKLVKAVYLDESKKVTAIEVYVPWGANPSSKVYKV